MNPMRDQNPLGSTSTHCGPHDPENLLDRAITSVLETPPPAAIPSNFAASVAAQARARFGASAPRAFPPARFRDNALLASQPRFGALAIRAVLVVLAVAIFVLAFAPGSARPVWITLDLAFAIELIALTLFLSLRSFTRH